MRRQASSEAGFTLIELLVAIVLGLLITGAAVTALANAIDRNDDVQVRTDATQRAQLAVDAVVRDLRSQACWRAPSPSSPPIISGTSTTVSLYLNFGADETTLQRRTLSLSSTGTLTERWWTDLDPTKTAVRQTRTLATNLGGADDGRVFRYYTFDPVSGNPTAELAAPLTATTAAQVARITVQLKGQQANAADTRVVPVVGEAFVRITDPDGSPVPVCA